MEKIREYDKRMTKRLLLMILPAFVVIILLLVAAEKTKVTGRIFSVGYEGPMQILPDITIIDNRGIESTIYSEEKHTMVLRDVEIFSEEEEDIDQEDPEISTAPEREIDKLIVDEVPANDYLRTYASHTSVPYRQDFVIIKMVKPEYPEDAFRRNVEGYVLVEVYVDESGYVSEAWVIKVQGLESFEKASLEAVRQFVFRPVLENGAPQPFWISFLINFRFKR